MPTINERMTQALEAYTERKVKSIKTFHDPVVADTWAARAVMEDNEQQIDS